MNFHSQYFEPDEDKVFDSFQDNYGDHNLNASRLPRSWISNSEQVSNVLSFSPDKLCVQNNSINLKPYLYGDTFPIELSEVYYFEVRICSDVSENFNIGFDNKNSEKHIYCHYYSNGVITYVNTYGKNEELAEEGFGQDDVIGVGINFFMNQIFFTKNGKKLATSPFILYEHMLYPYLKFGGGIEKIDTNFGQMKLLYDLKLEIENSLKNSVSMFHSSGDEEVTNQLQLVNDVDINTLPNHWVVNDSKTKECFRFSSDNIRVRSLFSQTFLFILSNKYIPTLSYVYYYEVHLINIDVAKNRISDLTIGLSRKISSINEFHCFYNGSGHLFGWYPSYNSKDKPIIGLGYKTGDVIGCGINFLEKIVFFTKNGKKLRQGVFKYYSVGDLFPKIMFQNMYMTIDTNFGQKPFLYDLRNEIPEKLPSTAVVNGDQVINIPSTSASNSSKIREMLHRISKGEQNVFMPSSPDQMPSINEVIQETSKSLTSYNLIFPSIEKEYDFDLNDFEYQDKIYSATNSVVKHYIHRPTKLDVAIKFLNIKYKRDTKMNTKRRNILKGYFISPKDQNIDREIKLLYALKRCPNITTYYGSFIVEDQLLICMEYMEMSLKDCYKRVYEMQGYFPELLLGIISVKILAALIECKKIDVIHRDVKPQNILMNR